MKSPFAALVAAGGLLVSAQLAVAQLEVQQPVQVNPPAAPRTTQGQIRPLLWQCRISDKACTLELAEVESAAIHDYIVDGRILVTEATVAMKSKTFFRFYYIEDAGPGGRVAETLKGATDRVEQATQAFIQAPAVLPGMPFSQKDKVVKNYPATTHAQMIEYRSAEKQAIYDIYNSLDKALIEFKSFPLQESQRRDAVRSVTIPK